MIKSRKSLKQWLADANGWRRIWFVATILTLIYFCLLFPFTQSSDGNAYRYRTKWAIEAEMKNPICAEYMNKMFSELKEPEYETNGKDGCYNIYSHRKYLKDNKPITEDEYLTNFEKEHWERILGFAVMGLISAIVLSAFVYGVGVVTSWIIKGFKKSESQ
jgi:hypothetical protein